MDCYALLGSHPTLSIAELRSRVGVLSSCEGPVALFESSANELSALQNQLGGIRQIGYVLGETKIDASCVDSVANLLLAEIFGLRVDRKVVLGMSAHSPALQRRLKAIASTLKRLAKESGVSLRVVCFDKPLSAASILKNKMLL